MAYLSYIYDDEINEYINIGGSDYTKIYYDTTENWNSNHSISIKQALYVYTDGVAYTDNEGNQRYQPKIKVGDGLAYISDLPFLNGSVSDDLYAHIADKIVHITQGERDKWNQKCRVDESDVENGNLILTIN